MRYRRALLLATLESDARAALAALAALAPELERVVIVGAPPSPSFAWYPDARAGGPAHDDAVLADLRALATELGAARRVDVQLVPAPGVDALVELAIAVDADLLVAGARSLRIAALLAAVGERLLLPLLWPREDALPGAAVTNVLCIALSRRARAAVAAFLRDEAEPFVRVTVVSPATLAKGEVEAMREVAGIAAGIVEVPAASLSLRRLVEQQRGGAIDLLVFPRIPVPLLVGAPWPAPVLVLPPPVVLPGAARPIDVADAVDEGGVLRTRVEYSVPIGPLPPLADESLTFVSGGRVVATVVTSAAGEVELGGELDATSLGVFRTGDDVPAHPLAAIEQHISIVRPGEQRLVVFDAELADEPLRALASREWDVDLLAVRLRPSRVCRVIRDRLRALGLQARVVDARAVLDEGDALDVSEALDALRLQRVASSLRRAGFPVLGSVSREPASSEPLVHPVESHGDAELAGNRIELELDNRTARRWLLEAIAASTESVHLQVYMAADDGVGTAVEAALAEAGARGVVVRVLVDSLHAAHGSFGTENPLLARLASRPGVELRISQPIRELPSITTLKQRDHRKLVVIDGRLALVGGRNLGHEYYTAFDEVRLTPSAPWREVPWLDAGARVEGPAVAAIARSFLDAWTEAGGASFAVLEPAPVGETCARVVVHRGLRDAHTLEAYLELVASARSHVYAVNGFPLVLELQHALWRALRRGVRVVSLVGHVAPTYGDQPFDGSWTSARALATQLVHARVDPLIDAGAEAYQLAVRDVPGWDPALGRVHPHVHAKTMSVDGRRCAVGSANFDVTSSYWESELMLIVEDAAVARGWEATIDALLASSVRVTREDPAWQDLARRRAWMRYWPGWIG